MNMQSSFTVAILCTGLSVSLAQAGDTPQQHQSEAKISESAARATALQRVPHGIVQSFELERESGKLIWSYDLKTRKSRNITEVQVDAITGKIVAVDVETPKDQAKEVTADKRGGAPGKS